MAEPFIGEIRLFGFGFAPQGWATCDGQALNINQNQALYALIGTTYGGSGTTFNLPDLRGRTLLHRSTTDPTYLEGKGGGSEAVTLTAASQLPAHTHALAANAAAGSTNVPKDNVPAAVALAGQFAYATAKASPPHCPGVSHVHRRRRAQQSATLADRELLHRPDGILSPQKLMTRRN